jgi:flagellar hook-associated protein 2
MELSGLASGFDWSSYVDQMTEIERAPQQTLQKQQSLINQRNSVLSTIKTRLQALQDAVAALKDPELFDARTASSSNNSSATATASASAGLGSYSFVVSQMASAASWKGAGNAGKALSTTNDVSGLDLSTAGFSQAVTTGTFTVNGKQVTIESGDTLGGVFDKISDATGGSVTAAYDPATDKISLTSSSEIILGSATDTSNFLGLAKLANNGSGTVTSTGSLGGVRTAASLAEANFETAVNDGGSGAGEFKINGVSIKFNASTDTVASVVARINASEAGVIAGYDAANDRFTLTNRETGDVGVGLEDVTGNFLSATGLMGGTLTRGNDLVYSVNGSGELRSKTNEITETSSGISGLSVKVLAEDSFSITVGSDQSKIEGAIQDFVTEYNKVQSILSTQTASTTDADGKVTNGILANDSLASEMAGRLRRLITSDLSGAEGITRMDDLGFASNGNDDSLDVTNESDLEDVLTNNLAAVKKFFSDENGFAASFDDYLESVIGDDGSLVEHMDSLTDESSSIDDQIEENERWVQVKRQQMVDSFVAMEEAQQKINQQLTYLNQYFGS